MAGKVKKLTYPGLDTGKSLFATVIQDETNSYLDTTDGAFRETPAAPAKAMAEKTIGGVGTKIYEATESTNAWRDGVYHVFVYEMIGLVPAYDTDPRLASKTIILKDDVIQEGV